MKSKFFAVLSGLIFCLGFTFTMFSQNCAKQTFCDPTVYGSFEYKSQTRSAVLSPGDTVRTTIVVYSEQITRVLLCGDPKLGDIKFKLYEPIKERQKYVRRVDVTEEEVDVYEKDENGEVKKDDWGDLIITGYEVVKHYDTVWGVKTVSKEIEIFDSKNNDTGKSYWEKEVDKSKRLVIEAIIPENSEYVDGCVNIRVGYKTIKEKTFKLQN